MVLKSGHFVLFYQLSMSVLKSGHSAPFYQNIQIFSKFLWILVNLYEFIVYTFSFLNHHHLLSSSYDSYWKDSYST